MRGPGGIVSQYPGAPAQAALAEFGASFSPCGPPVACVQVSRGLADAGVPFHDRPSAMADRQLPGVQGRKKRIGAHAGGEVSFQSSPPSCSGSLWRSGRRAMSRACWRGIPPGAKDIPGTTITALVEHARFHLLHIQRRSFCYGVHTDPGPPPVQLFFFFLGGREVSRASVVAAGACSSAAGALLPAGGAGRDRLRRLRQRFT